MDVAHDKITCYMLLSPKSCSKRPGDNGRRAALAPRLNPTVCLVCNTIRTLPTNPCIERQLYRARTARNDKHRPFIRCGSVYSSCIRTIILILMPQQQQQQQLCTCTIWPVAPAAAAAAAAAMYLYYMAGRPGGVSGYPRAWCKSVA